MSKNANTDSNVQSLRLIFDDQGGEKLESVGVTSEMLQSLFGDVGIDVLSVKTRSQFNQAVDYCLSTADGAMAFARRLGQFVLVELSGKTDLNSRMRADAISSWLNGDPTARAKMAKSERIASSGLTLVKG